MKFTILGGNGFIGRYLSSYLDSLGYDIWIPNREDKSIFSRPLGHVFYCIGLTADFRSRPFDTVRAHVTLLSELLEKSDFESLLYLSSTRVYANNDFSNEEASLCVSPKDPSDLYNLSKAMGESLCMTCARPALRIARLSNVVGPSMGSSTFLGMLAQEAIDGRVILQTHPNSAKDYILLHDVVTLLEKIVLNGKDQIYNVASGHQITHLQLLNQLQQVTGCQFSTNTNAPLQYFPDIDIAKIQNEFGFYADSVLEALPALVHNKSIF